MIPALITTVLETQDASKRDDMYMSDTLQAVMRPLVRAGVISLGQPIHPHGTYLKSGRTLKTELGKRCKAPQVAALNATARLLHTDPGSIDDHSALLRERSMSFDLSKEDRTIHPLNRHLTAGATAEAPDACPCPTQHVDPDKHLITQYLEHTSQPAVGTAPKRVGRDADDAPAQQEEAGAEQSAKRRCNSDRHKQHVPWAQMNVDRIAVGAFKGDKPHEEPYTRHDHNLRRVERLKAVISKELRGKATRQLAAVAIR